MSLRGPPDPVTGMVVELGLLQRAIEDVRLTLDGTTFQQDRTTGHPDVGNLSRFVWERLAHLGGPTRVSMHRDSCNKSCTYYGRQDYNS